MIAKAPLEYVECLWKQQKFMYFFFVSQLKFISEKVLQNQSFIDGFVDDTACYNKRVIFYQLIKTKIH